MNRKSNTIPKGMFSIGMLIALSLTLVAFEWTSTSPKHGDITTAGHRIDIVDEPIPVDLPEPPKPKHQPQEQKNETSKSSNVTEIATEITSTEKEVEESVAKITDGENEITLIFSDITDNIIDDVDPVNPDELDTKPYFPHCNQTSFAERFECSKKEINSIIVRNIRIPKDVKESHRNQEASIVFVVDRNGNIGEVTAINKRNLSPSVMAECERLIRMIPTMVPASKMGRPVPTYFRIPISFIVD